MNRTPLAALAAFLCAGALAAQEPIKIKTATLAPEGSTWMNVLAEMNSEVQEKTGGKVVFVFFPGGSLGDDKLVVKKLRTGGVQAAGITGLGLGEILPEGRILDVPYLYRNSAETDRIRERLVAADPKGAARILGRPFEIEGRVIAGDKRGRALGFPTANVRLGEYLRPANGIYAVRAAAHQGTDPAWMDGVANIGHRPMFPTNEVLLEVYLFDFSGDLYGRRLRVRLIDYLRPEKKFDGIKELTAQIADDSARARRILAAA